MATRTELIVFAVVGFFGTNAIPHFVQGVTGNRHMTPAGEESHAVLNVIWGSVNAAVAGILGWRYRDAIEGTTLVVAFVAGVGLALGLASYWRDEGSYTPSE
jgi:hypothetical protein